MSYSLRYGRNSFCLFVDRVSLIIPLALNSYSSGIPSPYPLFYSWTIQYVFATATLTIGIVLSRRS